MEATSENTTLMLPNYGSGIKFNTKTIPNELNTIWDSGTKYEKYPGTQQPVGYFVIVENTSPSDFYKSILKLDVLASEFIRLGCREFSIHGVYAEKAESFNERSVTNQGGWTTFCLPCGVVCEIFAWNSACDCPEKAIEENHKSQQMQIGFNVKIDLK
jgi:hypothetical protein